MQGANPVMQIKNVVMQGSNPGMQIKNVVMQIKKIVMQGVNPYHANQKSRHAGGNP